MKNFTTFLKVNVLVAFIMVSLNGQAQFYENTSGYTEENAASMGYPSQNGPFCDGVDRPNQQADCKYKTWDKLPDGTPQPGKVLVKKAPTFSGTPEQTLSHNIDQAGLSYGLADDLKSAKARLVQGYFAKAISSLAAPKNTINGLKNRPATYTGSGTEIKTLARFKELKDEIKKNHSSMKTYIFRGTIDFGTNGGHIEVGSNTTIVIDGVIKSDREVPLDGQTQGTPLGEREGGMIEIVGTSSNRKNNVKIIGTKRGQLEYKRKVGNAIYAEYVNNLVIDGVEMYNCYNSLHLKKLGRSNYPNEKCYIRNNAIKGDGRRAIHMKVCRYVIIEHNVVFDAWQDGIDIDSFTDLTEVKENLFIKSGNRFMVWTEVSSSQNLIENNVGIHYEGDDSNGGISENGSNRDFEKPTQKNTWRYNHVFYPHDGTSGIKMRDQHQINRPTCTFYRNYVWTLEKLPWHNPQPHDNIKDDVYYLYKGEGVGEDPTVSFAKPTDSQSYASGTNVEVKVDATDADGSIAMVELYLNGTLVRQESVAPYEWGLANQNDDVLANMQSGTYTLRAVATDNSGATAESSISVVINDVPTVSFVTPTDLQKIDEGSNLEVEVNAADADGTIADVKLYLNGTLVRSETYGPYEWGLTGQDDNALANMQAGSYELKAVATDNNGATATTTLDIEVAPSNQVIVQLKKGWNLIGCIQQGNPSPMEALSSIWDKVEVVKDMDSFYSADQSEIYNSLIELKFGYGYFIKVSEDCELIWSL